VEPSSETIPAPRARLSADGSTATAGDLELRVSATKDLGPKGATLTVTGHGYDTFKGVYVAFCKEPKANKVPTPCGGGATTEGSTGASQWVSSNPPPYGRGLTIPYGPDGSFTTTLRVEARLTKQVDCRDVQCVVITRNDHTRSTDRSQDVFVPVTFAGSHLASAGDGGGSSSAGAAIPIAAGAALTVAAVVGGIALLRRKRREQLTSGPGTTGVPAPPPA
jgi:hypothetical protein